MEAAAHFGPSTCHTPPAPFRRPLMCGSKVPLGCQRRRLPTSATINCRSEGRGGPLHALCGAALLIPLQCACKIKYVFFFSVVVKKKKNHKNLLLLLLTQWAYQSSKHQTSRQAAEPSDDHRRFRRACKMV